MWSPAVATTGADMGWEGLAGHSPDVEILFLGRNTVFSRTDFANGCFKNVDTSFQIFITDDLGAQKLHHLIVSAAGFNDESLFESFAGNFSRQLAIDAVDTLEHAATTSGKVAVAVFVDDAI